MTTDLAIIGQGCVTPAGVGVKALLTGRPVETVTPLLGRAEESWPVHRVSLNDPAFARWQREPRLRRASAISHFMVETAEQALAGIDAAGRAETGLVVAFSTGCLAYSRRLFEAVIRQGQKAASPALFPETVFNSPVSHVVATLHLKGAAYALVADATGWIAALKVAALWLAQERVRQVLVLGAEEFDAVSLDAYRAAGWLRADGTGEKFIPAEGAAGVLVRRAIPSDARRIVRLEDGFIFRTKAQSRQAMRRCLAQFEAGVPVYAAEVQRSHGGTQRGVPWDRPALSAPAESGYLGEAVTASAAWATLAALSLAGPRAIVPVCGMTHQAGALELREGCD